MQEKHNTTSIITNKKLKSYLFSWQWQRQN